MKRIPVSSSSILSIGYDAEIQTLEIEFVGGGVYQYFDVTQATHQALMASDSLGRFVNTKVKEHYRYVRVSDRKEEGVKGSARSA
jgi:hypothetical protein